MLSSKKSIIFLVVLIVGVCFCLGCGNQEQSKEDSKKLGKVDEIKKRGKVIVATEPLVPPYEFVKDGKIVGYGSDILAEIVKELGVELQQEDLEWSGLLPGLEAKKFDFLATSIAYNQERKEKFGLTTPIGEWINTFGKKAGNLEINTKEDLAGKKVGCVIGAVYEELLIDFKEKLEKEGKQSIEIVHYKGVSDAFMDLKNERIDALLCSDTTLKSVMNEQADTFERFDTLPSKERVFISWAVHKDDKDLLEFLNTEILKLKKSGKLAELQEKWFGHTFDLPDEI